MVFSCGETWEAKKARLREWHDFFVLWPRHMGIKNGKYVCVWLQTIQRSRVYVSTMYGGWWSDSFRMKS